MIRFYVLISNRYIDIDSISKQNELYDKRNQLLLKVDYILEF